MEDQELKQYAAVRLMRVHVEAARLQDPEEAAAIREKAARHTAALSSWRTRSPTHREVLVVLVVADRLLDRVRRTARAESTSNAAAFRRAPLEAAGGQGR